MTVSTEERYLIATNSTNLRVESEKHGDGDVMIASGWAPNRIGSALMRLHTKPTRDNLYNVHMQVTIKAESMNIERPDSVASAVIAWWLSRTCPVCFGRKYEVISSTPSLSAIECPRCHGSGEKKLPHGDVGRRLASWMDECKHFHVGMIKSRLRNNQQG